MRGEERVRKERVGMRRGVRGEEGEVRSEKGGVRRER